MHQEQLGKWLSHLSEQEQHVLKLRFGLEGNFAKEEELKSLEKKIDIEITESVKNALDAPEPPSNELTKYIWAED